MSKTQPIHEVRFGLIKAAIWENIIAEGTRFNVTFSRIYKDGEEWKSTESFGRDDLLMLAKVADHAHTWIHSQRPAKEPQNAAALANPTAARPSHPRRPEARA